MRNPRALRCRARRARCGTANPGSWTHVARRRAPSRCVRTTPYPATRWTLLRPAIHHGGKRNSQGPLHCVFDFAMLEEKCALECVPARVTVNFEPSTNEQQTFLGITRKHAISRALLPHSNIECDGFSAARHARS